MTENYTHYTYGPWKAGISGYINPKDWQSLRETGYSVTAPPDGKGGNPVVAFTHGHMAKGNARMIAAAPDLLIALEKLVAWQISIYDSRSAMVQDWVELKKIARAAIAKATQDYPR